MTVFPICIALLPVFSPAIDLLLSKCGTRTSKLVCIELLHAPKMIQIYQILGFAGVCGCLAVILGAVMCISDALVEI